MYRFHVDNNEGESRIGYDMIIGRNLMVQLGLPDNLKCQVLQWGGVTVPMKQNISLLGQTDITSCEMHKLVM